MEIGRRKKSEMSSDNNEKRKGRGKSLGRIGFAARGITNIVNKKGERELR